MSEQEWWERELAWVSGPASEQETVLVSAPELVLELARESVPVSGQEW